VWRTGDAGYHHEGQKKPEGEGPRRRGFLGFFVPFVSFVVK